MSDQTFESVEQYQAAYVKELRRLEDAQRLSEHLMRREKELRDVYNHQLRKNQAILDFLEKTEAPDMTNLGERITKLVEKNPQLRDVIVSSGSAQTTDFYQIYNSTPPHESEEVELTNPLSGDVWLRKRGL